MSKSEVRPESDDEWFVELLSSHADRSSTAAEAAESSMDVEGDTLQQLLTSHMMDGMSLLCQACWLSIQSFAKGDHVLHRQRADAKIL